MSVRGVVLWLVAGMILAMSSTAAGATSVTDSSARSTAATTATSAPTTAGTFVALSPARILDSRYGNGVTGAVAAKGTIHLQVLGRGGVPTSGVAAIVVNVTATSTRSTGHVTVFPDGQAKPGVSNLNFVAGQTVPNLVTVKVGSNGKIALYNHASTPVHLVGDVAGYYRSGTPTAPGAFASLTASRILDTRVGNGASGEVSPRATLRLQVLGRGGIPTSGVAAVVMNVTATRTRSSGYVTAFPDGQARPNSSNLNFRSGQTVPNLVTVKVGSNGRVALANNSAGSVHLLADVAGYYRAGTPTAAGAFVSLAPSRVLDTRYGNGAAGPVAARATARYQAIGRSGVLTTEVAAVVTNVTATSTRASGHLTVFPDGQSRPNASTVNWSAGQTVANLAVIKVGGNGMVALSNQASKSANFVGDVAGYFRAASRQPNSGRIGAASVNSCGVTATGKVKCWGNGSAGSLGNGSTTRSLVPVTVSGLSSGVTSIAEFESNVCAVNRSSGVVCWGENQYGQLGNGSTQGSSVPVNVTGLSTGVKAVAVGAFFSCALTSAGAVKCWGINTYGQLGNGTRTGSRVPVTVSGLSSGVVGISAGYLHACAVLSSGAVKCWGDNDGAQLGNGTLTASTRPVSVSGLSSGVAMVAGTYQHTCAVTTSGALKCWGSNYNDELGNGSSANFSTVPVNVSGLSSGVTAVAPGYYHTCALTDSGAIKCWGALASGHRSTPASVAGISDATAIAAGEEHTCAATISNGVKCWGINDFGQLGNGTLTNSNSPVSVSGF